jgi:hypothetical protein
MRPRLRLIPLALFAAAFLSSCSHRPPAASRDWLIDSTPFKADIRVSPDGRTLALENGLLRRELRIAPDAATVGLRNLVTGEALLRAVRPEAVLIIDGKKISVGGLLGQPDQAYLMDAWLAAMKPDPDAFHYRSHEIGPTAAPFPYARRRWSADLPWPPPGRSLTLRFGHDAPALAGIEVLVRYEIYDGLPLLAKSIRIENRSSRTVRLNEFASEILAVVEPEVSVGTPAAWDRPASLHVETDYAFNGMTPKTAAQAVHWVEDPSFTTQVNYERKTPCQLECRPPLGPDADIASGAGFDSFRTFELLLDSADRERRGLALRRMFRTIAPWTTENPIFLHLTSVDPATVKAAVDQCVAVGFEMIILSFGSGLDMENEDPAYRAGLKALADYAHAQGIQIGGYSLLASRRISAADDVINPRTGKTGGAVFGESPCLESRWGRDYFRRLKGFFEATGFDVLEHDGSYPGDVCASTLHPGHRGLQDSQWTQWKSIADFYRLCRERGVYLNVPDWYFLNGSSKTGIGYREVNWSLPRDRQIVLGRQNIYDGTWEKTPSMGWTFVPLVQYHGGGEAATLEPLAEHLDAYEAHLVQNFGGGVQACYRGPRLYDGEATRALVARWTSWYKTYRDILNSDIIHWRRPDGRDIDGFLHVNPRLPQRGLALFFNPTDADVERTVRLPLYYTGLTESALVREADGTARRVGLDRDYGAAVPIRVPARGFAWVVIEP